MADRTKLDASAIAARLPASTSGWTHVGDALQKSFRFDDYASGVAFAVRVAFAADKRDHHPEMRLGYQRVGVSWSTHDAGGVTELDVAMAQHTDALAGA